MNFKEKVERLLKETMTEKGFALWRGVDSIVPDIWDNPTSSTGKYHKKLNGHVASQAEHVYHMLYATIKIWRMINIEKNTTDGDKILLAIAFHDSLKYGVLGNRKHTDNQHDKNAADMISENKDTFLKLLTEDQFYTMEEAIRFHSGRWSTDAKYDKDFSFKNYNPETLVIHMLDMLSTNDLIQTDVRE